MIHRDRPARDRGASLLVVLIVVTVVAAVMSAVLTQGETQVRDSVALRDQASDNYAADGATKAVLNALQRGRLTCATPTSSTPIVFGNTSNAPFYQPASSLQGATNAYAECALDTVNGTSSSTSTPPPTTYTTTSTPPPVTTTVPALGAGDPSLPSYAILTTGSAASDFGIDFSTGSANGLVYCVENGSVGSNADIDVSKNNRQLAVRLNPTVNQQGRATPCTSGSGTATNGTKLVLTAGRNCLNGGQPNTFTPTACQSNAAQIPTPAPPALNGTTGVVNDPAPKCSSDNRSAAFLPGRYTTAAVLNNPCGSKTQLEWLSPGTYFFDFSACDSSSSSCSRTWTWLGTVIGGVPIDTSGNPLNVAPNSINKNSFDNVGTAPGSCQDPANVTGTAGTTIVLSGGSTIDASNQQVGQICAPGSSAAIPVALDSLPSDLNITTTSGAVTLPASSLSSTTSIINTGNSGNAQIYIMGYAYAPANLVDVTVKNTNGQVFNWGVIARNLRLFLNATSPTQPVIKIPKPFTGVGVVTTVVPQPPVTGTSVNQPAPSTSTLYYVRYINVWTCTVASLQSSGATRCPTSDGGSPIQPDVVVRIKTDPTGQGSPQILSWSQRRHTGR